MGAGCRPDGKISDGAANVEKSLSESAPSCLTWSRPSYDNRRMIVSIRDIAAWCVWCGGAEFELLSAEPLRLESKLKCSACGARYAHLQLIDQIGEEAMRRANKALDELRKRPPK